MNTQMRRETNRITVAGIESIFNHGQSLFQHQYDASKQSPQ